MSFEIVGEITEIETIAISGSIRELARLRRLYGAARWRKRTGFAMVRLGDGAVRRSKLHWYEASGIGRREMKIKKFLA